MALLLLLITGAHAQAPIVPAIDRGKFSSTIVERNVEFPSDGLLVPGTLALPAHRSGRVPVLVMVQGSGVQDRDSTIGPNKMFQQMAIDFAERGIATLRYDRRPKFAPASFLASPDLDHEVVIDAASALGYCETIPEVDPRAIFLLGHSLGAELAPYIVQRRLAQFPNSVRGMILLSGIAQPIDVAMLAQIRTLGKAQGGTQEQIDEIVSAWAAVFAAVKDPKTPDTEPLGVGTKIAASYWRDWLGRNPVAAMATLNVPALVLRGENDNNTTHADFEALRRAATAPGSASREFPGLNHEYQVGTGNGMEIMQPAEVDAAPVDVIAEWVKSGKLR
jgi:dienelactone hydrolase